MNRRPTDEDPRPPDPASDGSSEGDSPAAAPYLLVGGGRLARHLGHYFDLLGVSRTGWVRADGPATLAARVSEARAVLLLIPDDAIEGFVDEHRDALGEATLVHCSGVRVVPGVRGCHPLGSFGDVLLPEALYRSLHFVLEPGGPGFGELFPDLPNPHTTMPADVRTRYHAAAVLSGNFTAMLWRRAARVFDDLGLPSAAWTSYLETVSHNIRAHVDTAVTGPVVRGDAGTIAAHLEELGDDPWAGVYRAFLAASGVPDPTRESGLYGSGATSTSGATPGSGSASGSGSGSDDRPTAAVEPEWADRLAVFRSGSPLVATTAYDASTAAILDTSPLDFLLVGDSVAMVVYGHRSTRPADVEMLARHTAAVRRGAPSKPLVTDLPWVATRDPELGVRAARELMRAGADGVKLEALPDSWDVLERLVAEGVPVMGHVGLLPQLVEQGDYRVAGRGEAAEAVRDAARMQEEAGCFALVVECVPSDLGARITEERSIPTIGIGAGPSTSGQILVVNDLCGLTPGGTPRFVREFGDAATPMADAVRSYVDAVRDGTFPSTDESYG